MATADHLTRGRDAFGRRAWTDACALLAAADRDEPLQPDDLERFGTAAYLIGKDAESTEIWTRAHHGFLAAGAVERAARCAFWLAFGLMNHGERARAGAWIARAQRLLETGGQDCVERGYLLLPIALQRVFGGDPEGGYDLFCRAAAIGDRFGDLDLIALARHSRGRVLIRMGRIPGRRPSARRGHDRRRRRRGVSARRRRCLLQRHRGVPGDLRSPPGPGVDRGADTVV